MVTYTGRYINPRLLDPERDIDITDIGQGLSKTCRYAGQCQGFYSVAQHSVHVYEQVREWAKQRVTIGAKDLDDLALCKIALLHDAPEAYLGDLVRCVKVGLPDYDALEEKVWQAVCLKFGLQWGPLELPQPVKEADYRMCVTERNCIIGEQDTQWDLEQKWPPYHMVVDPWPPEKAYEMFMRAFHSLYPGC